FIAAVVWGIGISLYGFYMGPQMISWTVWGARLLGGIAACVAIPVVLVRGPGWMAAATAATHSAYSDLVVRGREWMVRARNEEPRTSRTVEGPESAEPHRVTGNPVEAV
ncbi:MAG: hypothetical protein ACREMY_30175, partial [bacterium]